jgi:hypothetical protein
VPEFLAEDLRGRRLIPAAGRQVPEKPQHEPVAFPHLRR